MPTTRPRHQVTETPMVTRALDLAARHWPDDSRSALLQRVLAVGLEELESRERDRAGRHRGAVQALAETYAGVYRPNYLSELREDWPE